MNEKKIYKIKVIKSHPKENNKRDIMKYFKFIIFISILIGLGMGNVAKAATNTWQNGGVDTNWNTAGNWTDGVPTADDDCILPAGTQAMTINAAAVCRSFDASAYDNTITHNAAITLTIGDATAGAGNVALAFSAGMTYTLVSSTTAAISFISTSATVQTINFNGKNTGNVTFNAASNGSWQLTGTWGTSAAAQTITLTKGTLDTNGQAVYASIFTTAAGTKTLTLGNSTITLSRASGTAWSWSTTTATLNENTSTIVSNGATATFAGGGDTYATVTLNGSGTATITGVNSFGTLNRTGTAVKTDALVTASNQTVTGTLNFDGNSSINRLLFYATTLGTPITLTITGATISGSSNVDFRDITFANGGANVDFSGITGGSGDRGGNTISGGGTLSFTTADTETWNNTNGGNWSDVANWTGVVTTRVPLPQDDVEMGIAYGTSKTVTIDMPYAGKNIDWTGATYTTQLTWSFSSPYPTIYGSLNMTNLGRTTYHNYNGTIIFEGRSAFTLTSDGKTLPRTFIRMIGGSLTLQDNYRGGGAQSTKFSLENGTFDANDYDVNLDNGGIAASGRLSVDGSSARTLYMGSGTWTLSNYDSSGSADQDVFYASTITNLNFYAETSTIIVNSAGDTDEVHFDATGGLTFNNISLTGRSGGGCVFSGSSVFNVFTINAPLTVKFTANTTTTVSSFVATGTAANPITITSLTSAAHTLTDTAGTNSVSYSTISYSQAGGGATWNANDGTNTDGGSNSGWIWTLKRMLIRLKNNIRFKNFIRLR